MVKTAVAERRGLASWSAAKVAEIDIDSRNVDEIMAKLTDVADQHLAETTDIAAASASLFVVGGAANFRTSVEIRVARERLAPSLVPST